MVVVTWFILSYVVILIYKSSRNKQKTSCKTVDKPYPTLVFIREIIIMYICSVCQYGSKIKVGKCPNCGEFGTMQATQSINSTKLSQKILAFGGENNVQGISYPLTNPEIRSVLWDSVMGSGVYLLAWEPGMGKSTLALQLIHDIIKTTPDLHWAYYSGEETASQVEMRYRRLYPDMSQSSPVFHTTSCEAIMDTSLEYQHQLIVIDSIQTITTEQSDSSPGSPAQVRTCAELLTSLAKQHHVTVLIIGHVTKGGEIAGPKYLEHIVDVVLYLEGDRTGDMRFLRNYKNRFGHADGTGIFGMTGQGLQPLYEPEKMFIWQLASPGIAWGVGLDNGRPVLTWIETLLTKSYGKFPERHYVGVSAKRVDMIIAILEKYLNCKLAQYNVFVNIPWEFHLHDSGLDLAIAMAIYSGYTNTTVPEKTLFLGELWLTGHISKTRQHEKRRSESPKKRSIIDYEVRKSIGEAK